MSRTAAAAHRTKWALRGLVIPLAAAVLVACSGSSRADAPYAAPAAEPGVEAVAAAAGDVEAAPTAGDAQADAAAPGSAPAGRPAQQRRILKNGTLRIVVADPDIAVDRITQLAAEAGGYILSSKVWLQEQEGQPAKYASISLSVPAEQFEPMLTRLRGLAVRVVDETAAGEDVTDQYVDLEAQLRNLHATRDRIRTFLDQAKTVEEALKVNEQLAAVEAQIEQTQGRLNYLAGRSAFSTIGVEVEPDLAPAPPPTPAVWSPNATFERAGRTLARALQSLADLLIWFIVVALPLLLVLGAGLAAILWIAARIWPKRPAPEQKPEPGSER